MSHAPAPDSPPNLRGEFLRDDVGGPDRIRSQLVRIAGVAVALITLFAVAGLVVASAGLYPASATAVAVGVAVVLVAAVGMVMALQLLRRLPDTPVVTYTPMPPQPRAGSTGPVPIPRVESVPTPFAAGDQRGEMLATLSQRLQSLVNQLIRKIDKVENEIEDPDLLQMVWEVDHLATRARRETENIAVLGGEALQRRSDTPVDVNAVLRAAVAEVQHYRRVTKIPVHNASIQGHVVSEVIHLLAELVENAATFTPDDAPKVAVRAHYVAAGLEILVQDRGIGMYPEDMATVNRLLNGTTQFDIGRLLKGGRIGLAVVKELAQRHGIAVQLQSNIYGGVDASVVVPHELLGPRSSESRGTDARQRRPFDDVANGNGAHGFTGANGSNGFAGDNGPNGAHAAEATPRSSGPKRNAVMPPAPQPTPGTGTGTGTGPNLNPGTNPSFSPSPAATGAGPFDQFPPAETALGQHGRTPFPDGRPEHADPRGPQSDPTPSHPGLTPVERRRPGAALAELESRWEPTALVPDETASETTQTFAPIAPDLGAVEPAAAPPEPGPVDRPPLPHRRARQTHLRPELLEPLGHTRPIPGHNPDLMADLYLGQARGDAELAGGTDRADDGADSADQPHQPPLNHAQGDTSSWPRI